MCVWKDKIKENEARVGPFKKEKNLQLVTVVTFCNNFIIMIDWILKLFKRSKRQNKQVCQLIYVKPF